MPHLDPPQENTKVRADSREKVADLAPEGGADVQGS